MKITEVRSSDDDGEGKFTVEMDQYQIAALTRVLARLESTYSGYTAPYTSRYAESNAISSFLGCARVLDIPSGL